MIAKLLALGIMAVLAVMILTAIFHVIAPYIAALLVLVLGGWILLRCMGKDTEPKEPGE